jgi:hypothetical protein
MGNIPSIASRNSDLREMGLNNRGRLYLLFRWLKPGGEAVAHRDHGREYSRIGDIVHNHLTGGLRHRDDLRSQVREASSFSLRNLYYLKRRAPDHSSLVEWAQACMDQGKQAGPVSEVPP